MTCILYFPKCLAQNQVCLIYSLGITDRKKLQSKTYKQTVYLPSFLMDYLSSHLLPNASLRTQGRRQLSSFYFSLTHHINKGVMHLVQPQTPGSQTLRGADHQHLTHTVIYTQDAPMWSENYSPGYKLPNSSKQKNGSGSYLLHSSFLKSNQNNQFSVNLRL